MKKFNNIFIHDITRPDQYVFIIDGQCYYKFNGKYALYELSMTAEKKEYAQRLGNQIEVKQVFGLFSGQCPECGEPLTNVPVVKKINSFFIYCDKCATPLLIDQKQITPIVNVLELHSNRREIFEYEKITPTDKDIEQIKDDFDCLIEEEMEDE